MTTADPQDHALPRTGAEPLDRIAPRLYLLAALLLAGAVGLLLGAAWLRGVPLLQMLDDPASYHEVSPLSGLVSYGGVWLMSSTAAICAFAAHVGTRKRGLLAGVAAFSAYFALDDLLMLHEAVWPRIGIPEEVILLGFAAALLATLLRTRALAAPAHPFGLYLALALMAGSIVIDLGVTPDGENDAGTIIEDVLKFVALGIWTLFWTAVASAAVTARNGVQRRS
ncbi:hypothetical protein KTN05_14230 [Paracoccus sp. Z118]|uniref:hypothetical protein n=1 Tax=Paracoccus sp. Z118 TaxID=2851017 RepID=UPI001C2BABB9|nr:hypothetical protein [Paracoccus sp. Z118]MBV0892993.1 hypothetical protein [Paracoccus sp. Z118]